MPQTPEWFVLDTVIVLTIVISSVLAAWHGIVRTLFGLLACVLALAVALLFTAQIASIIPFLKNYPLLSTLVSFVLLFVGVLLAVGIPGGLFYRLLRRSGMGFVDRGLGFLFGIARGVVMVLAVLWVVELVPGFKMAIEEEPSHLRPLFSQAVEAMRPWFLGMEWPSLSAEEKL
ncbi:MAG: CvpA family protein [Burkholderiales bacterium]|jgi:membrane protein required for colicin V production|nr:CvpA family protein [Burkholderiales bacterium]